jgi:NAD-dependent deacetylase
MKKKVVVFTGAGLDSESGINTFRDSSSGLWYNYNVDDVATIDGWRRDKAKVLEFHNKIRSLLPSVQPNGAHKALVSLEESFDVIHITQNVSDLLERAGSTNVIHLHGELTKARRSIYNHKTSPLDEVIDIGYNEINIGDTCPINNTQIRPHVVWFGEIPFGVEEAYEAIFNADILLIIGTSLQIGYTLPMLSTAKNDNKPACEIYYIDPSPMRYLDNYGLKINYIEKTAVEGVTELVNALIAEELQEKID